MRNWTGWLIGASPGLWLIGLWQRSEASRRIKQIMGNPEAVASAYSLHSYHIADDLGGEEAFAKPQSPRLAARHPHGERHVPTTWESTSDWVIFPPEWFVSLDYSPFPRPTHSTARISAAIPESAST
jgi:hypothetical protein